MSRQARVWCASRITGRCSFFCALFVAVGLLSRKRMSEQRDKAKKPKRRGGPRVAGPGKKMGRPTIEEAHAKAQVAALMPVPMTPDNILPPIVRPAYEQIKELETGMGPVDIMIKLARYHFEDFLKECGKKRPKVELKHAYAALARAAAAAAAPFTSPRLASVRHSGSVNNVNWNADMLMAVMAKLPEAELQALERIFALVAATAGPAEPGAGHHPAAAAPAPGGS